MPKKILIIVAIVLLSPVLVSAAYNDVALANNAVISSGGYNVTVYGSDTVLKSIVVTSSDFSVVLSAGSVISVMSSDRISLPISSTQTVTSAYYCEATDSLLNVSYSADTTGDTTVTVTPSSGVCGASTSSSVSTGNSNGPVGGGGGGGAYTPVTAPTPTPTPTVTPAVSASGLSATQIDAIISLLTSFGAEQNVIANVRASLAGGSVAGVSGKYNFKIDLKLGSRGNDVKNLQRVLNSNPDTRITSTGSGSPGNETDYLGSMTVKAIQKFQLKYKITSSGSSGYGRVGPATRAKLNELSK